MQEQRSRIELSAGEKKQRGHTRKRREGRGKERRGRVNRGRGDGLGEERSRGDSRGGERERRTHQRQQSGSGSRDDRLS